MLFRLIVSFIICVALLSDAHFATRVNFVSFYLLQGLIITCFLPSIQSEFLNTGLLFKAGHFVPLSPPMTSIAASRHMRIQGTGTEAAIDQNQVTSRRRKGASVLLIES